MAHRIRGRWLQPEDVVLVVEVAQTSIRYDTGRKARDYATWGVAEYWVVDIDRRRIVAHRDPGADGYGTVEVIAADTAVGLPQVAVELRLAEVLPPASPI